MNQPIHFRNEDDEPASLEDLLREPAPKRDSRCVGRLEDNRPNLPPWKISQLRRSWKQEAEEEIRQKYLRMKRKAEQRKRNKELERWLGT